MLVNVKMDENGVMFRYKYRDMHDNSLKIITDGTIYFASPLEFNDPFDSAPVYDDRSIADFVDRRRDIVRAAGRKMRMSPAKRLMQKGQMTAKLAAAIRSGAWASGLYGDVGIFCVSRTPCSLLMWSHYADEHRGFVIEFGISARAPHVVLKASAPIPVNYSETRPLLSIGDRNASSRDYFLTKSPDWSYEQEERIFQNQGGPGVYSYSREHILCSIIAGARICDSDFQKLKRAVEQAERDTGKQIPLYRARLSPTRYAVIVPGHPDPEISGGY